MSYDPSTSPCAIYISWPFTSPGQYSELANYHNVLHAELKKFGLHYTSNVPLESIYWGGGCLSTYPEDLLLDTSATLRNMFTFSQATEVTFEIDSRTVCKEQLELWGRLGVNRLVIRVKNLEDLGLVPFDGAQSIGLKNIAIDLTLGEPGVSKNEWETLIHAVATRPVTHLSVYFSEKTKSDDHVADAYCWTVRELAQRGFVQYETYSFTKPGFQSKQQQVYFDRKPYKGFGVGACSSERVTPEQERLEKLMLGLRQAKGIKRSDVRADARVIAALEEQGLLKKTEYRLALTPRGFLVSNEIIMKLF